MPHHPDRLIQPGRGFRLRALPILAPVLRQGLALLAALALAACSQIGSLQRVPTLPPTFAIPTEALPTATPSPIPPNAPMGTRSGSPTLESTSTETPLPATLTTAEVSETQSAATLSAFIQTQLETLGKPTLSPTPCPSSGCKTATSTRTPRISRTPTLTSTAIFPAAYIQITWPGPLSKVVSPIHLQSSTHTGPNATLQIELLGEDGRILYRQVYRSSADDVTYYNLNLPIDYEIPGVAEAGRLDVTVMDAAKRLVAEKSLNLVLLAMGDEEVNPPDDGMTSIVIRQPYVYQLIKGGTLHVQGLVRPMNDSALFAELYTDDGKLVGSRQFSTADQPLGVYRPFSVDIPYTVTQQRGVRLTISQQGDKIAGVILAESVLVWLEP
jgi:hypothetical protein